MDYSLLLYFLKKINIRDDESSMSMRMMKMSLVERKDKDGQRIFEL